MSLSGERNVFVDARAVASSSISAADKENNEEGGGCGGHVPAPRVVPEVRGEGAGSVVVT